MAKIAYVNGEYLPLDEALVNIEDRGYQFADGVYEVCLVVDGAYWDEAGHLARWKRSLDALSIEPPMAERALRAVMKKVLQKNRLKNALVYMQATRGVAPRNHPFPKDGVAPSLVLTARPFDLEKNNRTAERGVGVITAPDIRWGRVDIKSISLLPNVLAKQAAHHAGAVEALLVRDGVVTEGSSSNAWIVADDGELKTHPKGTAILGGITRETVLECAKMLQIKVNEKPFSVLEAEGAREAFITSATNLVMPVVEVDGKKIADGQPGPLTMRLRRAYIDLCRERVG